MSPRQPAISAGGAERIGAVGIGCFLFLLATAPLMRGGNRHVAMILLEIAALACLAAVFARGSWRTAGMGRRELLLGVVVCSPLWLAALYLLPTGWWAAPPGREIYPGLLAGAGIPIQDRMPLSLVPDATRASLLAGIPLVAGFIVGYWASLRQLQLVLTVLVAMAFGQVALGLLQVGSPGDSFLYFGLPGGRPVGSFANPNHLANYIAMALAAYVLLGCLRLHRATRPARPSSRVRMLAVWAAGAILLLVGVLMSRSRGAALAGLPAALAAIALALAHVTRSRRWGAGVLLVATLTAAVALPEFKLVLSRFELHGLVDDAAFRTALAASTLDGAAQFWPWGAGWGTYAAVFPRFQPSSIVGFADYAHHDYAQLLFEGGLFAALLMAVIAWLAIVRAWLLVRSGLRNGRLGREELTAAICGLGLLGFLVHSFVEFNMHIPANALSAALLAGIYLRPLENAAHPLVEPLRQDRRGSKARGSEGSEPFPLRSARR